MGEGYFLYYYFFHLNFKYIPLKKEERYCFPTKRSKVNEENLGGFYDFFK